MCPRIADLRGLQLQVRKIKPTRVAPGGPETFGYPHAGARVQQQVRRSAELLRISTFKDRLGGYRSQTLGSGENHAAESVPRLSLHRHFRESTAELVRSEVRS